jgi:hypothetical protein
MKRVGCGLGIVGLLLCAGSFALLGSSIFRAFEARKVAEVPLEPGRPADTGVVAVDTDKLCQVAISTVVHSAHVTVPASSSSSPELEYAFPLRYTVFDEAGNVVANEETELSGSGGVRQNRWRRIDGDGGSESFERSFDKFAVPPPGNVRVVAELGESLGFDASLESTKLVFYDRVSKHARRVVGGVVLLVAGGLLGLVGGMLFVFAALKR